MRFPRTLNGRRPYSPSLTPFLIRTRLGLNQPHMVKHSISSSPKLLCSGTKGSVKPSVAHESASWIDFRASTLRITVGVEFPFTASTAPPCDSLRVTEGSSLNGPL